MKTHKYQRRFYRDWAKSKDLYPAHIIAQETDLQIFTDKPLDKDFVKERVYLYRRQIENYITRDRRFLTALKPVAVELNAPPIVKRMAQASRRANVGPMAAVAGAVAEFLGRDLLKRGYREIIVENGGDIFIATSKTRRIGLYAGKSRLWNKLSFKIKGSDTPIGICASSGTLGHSLSFGRACAVIILSKNVSLADAVATACANRVKSTRDSEEAMGFAKSIKGVLGIIIIIKNHLTSCGKVEFSP